MKKALTLLFLIFTTATFAQKDGQNFCDGDDTEGYFKPLNWPKIVVWYNTHYNERAIGEKVLEGKTYKIYVQEWEAGSKDTLYLREEGTKTLEYYKETKKEIVRFDDDFKLGHQWKGNEARYKIRSFTEELLTPVCRYRNLMVMEAVYPKTTFLFYYLKGFGYVGATKDGRLISFVVPNLEVIAEMNKMLEEINSSRIK